MTKLCFACDDTCACEKLDIHECAGRTELFCPCHCHTIDWEKFARDKAMYEAAAELLAVLKDFPGHVSEDSWYNWIARKNAVIAKAEKT